ncbi:MAG: T9SS type A sorting domain-containing protein [Bacteroidota bacterium]
MFIKNIFLIIFFCYLGYSAAAQDVTFAFANDSISNNGNSFEADVVISSAAGFKLGSGQLYLNYNSEAFGENVVGNNRLTITRSNVSLLSQTVGAPPFIFDYYNQFITADNTVSRFSFSWQHAFSDGCLSANNVNNSDALLFHIKLDFIPGGQSFFPGLCFESTTLFSDQTFTACGPANCVTVDCNAAPGQQITDDNFDCSAIALPVELLFFKANLLSNETVSLDWQTALEINSSHFDVEKMTDGTEWHPLKTIPAKGNSSTTSNYQTIDEKPVVGLNHYRLKMVDLDGSSAYSKIESVRLKSTLQYSIFPNPVEREFNLNIDADQEGELTVEMYNARKQIILTGAYQLDGSPFSQAFDVAGYTTGIYWLKLEINQAVYWEKIIIQ